MFSCPLGAITNLTVSYHEKQHSTTINKLPTEVSFSFTIEDLSPTMYMAMSYGSSWDGVKSALLGDTSNFAEFLKALGGVDWNNDVGLAGLKRRMAILWRNFKGTTMNPVLGGMSIGNLGISRAAFRLLNLVSAGSIDKVHFNVDDRQ
ncbi:aldose 1-epimerase [Lasius niger]|uniref:Aldose 1-epimerase n=1 Tax=Lasius niger TaxID=67767 RepID=A0A0J7JU33_LASNI|nr:aldose 1-epimerase [Lasius niger]